MRSSRVLSAEAGENRKKEKRIAVLDKKKDARRTPVIACASRRGRAEADSRRFSLRRRSHLEELARLEAQHVREYARRKLLDLGVQVPHHRVVIPPGVL